jgi:transglutaminase-like putative cysteine protease
MLLKIRHQTRYRYSTPARYSIQYLRLTPRAEAGQRVLSWRIDTPGRVWRQVDAFGNVVHVMAITGAHDEITITVEGTVETSMTPGAALGYDSNAAASQLPIEALLVPTDLTTPDSAIRAIVAQVNAAGGSSRDRVMRLMQVIHGVVQYETGSTDVEHTAAQALAQGRGVCQDHAHIFLACARAAGLPSRYVSGYLDTDSNGQLASHAWVDVWIEGEGWVSCDVTNARYASEAYCRLAVGRDYLDASPVRGRREGGADESLEVTVHVSGRDLSAPDNTPQ